MRIGCGRLVAVLWTLLMKDTSLLRKHHEGRLFLRQTSSAPLLKRYGKGRYNEGAEGGTAGRLFGVGRGYGGRTYTLCGQNVYVSCPRRIRFTLETYTFSPPNVYVLLTIRIRLDEKGYTFGSHDQGCWYFWRRMRQHKGGGICVENARLCLQARDTASPQQVPRGRLLGALL